MKPRVAVSLLLVLVLALLTGCGSSGSSSGTPAGATPSKLVPYDAPVYVEAAVRPQGQLGDDADAALKKLLHTDDPGAKVAGLANKLLAKSGLSYDDDIKPWLGERIGFFATSFAQGKVVGALIAETTDSGKAKSALEKLAAKNGKASKKTYKGVDLAYDAAKGNAAGIVDDFAVIGPLSGVQRAIDTAQGGRPITDVPDYTSARTAVGGDQALAIAYVKPQALVDALAVLSSSSPAAAQSAATLGFLRKMTAKAGRAVGVGLHATGDAINLQVAELGPPPASPGPSGADELAALPGDAWLGIGFGDISKSLGKVFGQLKQLSALSGSANGLGAMFGGFTAKTGINLQRDILSWMGSGAIYARGSGLTDLGVVFTVHSKNPAKSHRAVGLIANALHKAGSTVQSTTVEG